MQAKLAEAGGPAGLQEIRVPGPGLLAFVYADGRRVELPWINPSRRDSWTPAMKEAARQKEFDRRAAGHVGVPQDVVLEILHGAFPADEQQGIAVPLQMK